MVGTVSEYQLLGQIRDSQVGFVISLGTNRVILKFSVIVMESFSTIFTTLPLLSDYAGVEYMSQCCIFIFILGQTG